MRAIDNCPREPFVKNAEVSAELRDQAEFFILSRLLIFEPDKTSIFSYDLLIFLIISPLLQISKKRLGNIKKRSVKIVFAWWMPGAI